MSDYWNKFGTIFTVYANTFKIKYDGTRKSILEEVGIEFRDMPEALEILKKPGLILMGLQ